jgi:hypothetical protein
MAHHEANAPQPCREARIFPQKGLPRSIGHWGLGGIGAGGGTRTRKSLGGPEDFKSPASASFATPAPVQYKDLHWDCQ